jgi:anti-sigma-K factor RskA
MNDEHAVRDLLPGYALGILEDGEMSGVREHLARCASCRDELAGFRDVTGRMAAALPDGAPRTALEGRIMDAIAGPRRRRRPAAGSRRGAWPVLTAVAAMCVIALGAGNVLQWTGVLAPQAHAPQPRLTTALLSGVGETPNAYGTIVLDPMDNKGVLAVTGLHRLDRGHQYQLWLIKDGQRRSGGVFSPDAEGYGSMLLTVPVDFKDFRSFGVSIEPWGGSPAPTGPRVLTGSL